MTRARPDQSYGERSSVRRLATIGFLVTTAVGIALVAIAVIFEEILPDCAVWCQQEKRAAVFALVGFLLLLLSGLGLIAVLVSFLRSRFL